MKKLALALVVATSVLGGCASKKQSSTLPSNTPSAPGGQAPDGANTDDPAGAMPASTGAPMAEPSGGGGSAPSTGSETDPCAGGE